MTGVKVVDYAAGRPGAAAVKAAGYRGAVRYLANSPDRGLPNKILTREELDDYRAQGLAVAGVWQKGKHVSADWRRGEAGGVADALDALAVMEAVGAGDDTAPVFFAIDEDVSLAQWNTLCSPYLKGAAKALGKQRVGAYGGIRAMWWAEEDALVGDAGNGKLWLWQTRAWSTVEGKLTWHPKAVLRQERIDQDAVAGVGIDVNTVWNDDWGQWRHPRGTDAPPPAPPVEDEIATQFLGPGGTP